MKTEVNFEHFDLKKVKANKEGVEFSFTEKNGKEFNVKHPNTPHPDLLKPLNELKYYMAMRIGLIQPLEEVQAVLGKNKEAHSKIEELIKSQTERCEVSGISFAGSGSLFGVKITGSLRCEAGVVGMATPTIIFESDKLGYEDDVASICDEIKKEVYCLHFKNKKAQQDLYDQAEEFDAENENSDEAEND